MCVTDNEVSDVFSTVSTSLHSTMVGSLEALVRQRQAVVQLMSQSSPSSPSRVDFQWPVPPGTSAAYMLLVADADRAQAEARLGAEFNLGGPATFTDAEGNVAPSSPTYLPVVYTMGPLTGFTQFRAPPPHASTFVRARRVCDLPICGFVLQVP